MYIPTASVFQICSADHVEPDLTGRTARTPLSSPEKTRTSLTTSGVTMFCMYGVVNGRLHSSAPVSAATDTIRDCDCVTICRVPARSTAMGDA